MQERLTAPTRGDLKNGPINDPLGAIEKRIRSPSEGLASRSGPGTNLVVWDRTRAPPHEHTRRPCGEASTL